MAMEEQKRGKVKAKRRGARTWIKPNLDVERQGHCGPMGANGVKYVSSVGPTQWKWANDTSPVN